MATREEEILRREQAAIQKARDVRLAPWQVQVAYYVAMLNNAALRDGGQAVTLTLTPGSPPTLQKSE
jgi:hypothetical protein